MRSKYQWCLAALLFWAGSLTAIPQDINYTYNDAGQLIRVDYGDGKSINYSYDANGNLTQKRIRENCFDVLAFKAALPTWPGSRDVRDLISLTECTEKASGSRASKP